MRLIFSPQCFSQVLVPRAVILLATTGMEKLQAGEQAAILLAESMKADVILLDEKAASHVALAIPAPPVRSIPRPS